MTPGDRLEAWLVSALAWGMRAAGRSRARAAGERLGDLARLIGVRRRVAETQLAAAFPERGPEALARILVEHYRELGRVVAEYARLPELARAPLGEGVAEARGMEHLERAYAGGRGAILMSGHFSNFELVGAHVAQRFPMDFVVRPLSNPVVEEWVARLRAAAGVGTISADDGVRGVFRALRAGRGVAMLADQDARRHGVFVPFLGRPASTALGPARVALATGAPIVTGFALRRPDGRVDVEVDPPLELPDPRAPDAALTITARHVERLERRVRQRPELWFWLHRRWKSQPPGSPEREGT